MLLPLPPPRLQLMALLRQEVSYPREVQLQRGVSGRAEVDAVNLFAAVSEICRELMFVSCLTYDFV